MIKYHSVELQKKIEALLFATDDPIGIKEMASLLMENEDAVKKELKKLMKDYASRETSIAILSVYETDALQTFVFSENISSQ